MNETVKTMLERKSCRSYKAEQITDAELQCVIDAGLAAPSGRNLQPTLIVAVQDKDTIAKLSRINASVMGVDKDPFYGAPTVAVVLAKKSSRTSLEDASLVLGNMLLAAYSIGLGGCWIHRARETFESEEGRELLREWGIEEEVYGVGNCILGYPDGEFHPDFEKLADRAIIIK
ncbi:MAG: nitroreductase [Clostridia bacterium]|nr:nitroreductase [Clostridia bacterium]